MKKFLCFVPVVLSLLVLGAHFLRYGNLPGVVASAVLLGLLLLRRPWVAMLMQVALVLGALEWFRTLYALAQFRAAHEQPFGRMVFILGIVAMVALGSALLFRLPALRDVYRGRPGGDRNNDSFA